MIATDMLSTEVAFFETHRKELVEKAPGKFALIKGDVLVGTYDSEANAYAQGVTLFGTEAFLIKEILSTDLRLQIPAYYAGVLHVGI